MSSGFVGILGNTQKKNIADTEELIRKKMKDNRQTGVTSCTQEEIQLGQTVHSLAFGRFGY